MNEEEIKNYRNPEGDGLTFPRIEKELIKLIKSGEYKLPVFLRTDETSAKHQWKETCFINNLDNLKKHFFELTCFSKLADMMGLDCNAFFVREYIPMNTLFHAFWGEMPVNPEFRIFINKNDIICGHWYWIEEAMRKPSNRKWRYIIKKAKLKLEDAKKELVIHAATVAQQFNGFWSVDFCQAKDGTWYLIDMAEGQKSCHDETCDYKRGT